MVFVRGVSYRFNVHEKFASIRFFFNYLTKICLRQIDYLAN